jgi:AraC family transcriptional regulator, regulatory protein of adaptative response / methylated-DNA-[protein]-cysteine methyltransferase
MNTRLQPAVATQIDVETAWTQVLARDKEAGFFYAVTTTGVFCRPACTSRRPLRENVRFFSTIADARRAGFRACRRCKPDIAAGRPLEEIRKHLEANIDRRVGLEELGPIAGVSPFTAQKMFKRAMGVSPSQYQRALRAGTLRAELKNGASVTTAIYNAGFNSSSRAYEADALGMAPGRFAAGGRGEKIGYATGRTPFGWMIVGATARGLCWLALADSEADAEQMLRDEFPAAELQRDGGMAELVEAALASVREGHDLSESLGSKAALDLRGTVFQLRVWQALRQIPRGETRSYSQLAAELGDRNATRAVARACATNRVAILVPCHRVVRADGSPSGYRWGEERKRRLLETERRTRSESRRQVPAQRG